MATKVYQLYPDRPGLLSNSGMNTFLGCPKKFGFKYWDKIQVVEEEKTTAMDRGKAFHELAETKGESKDGDILDYLNRDLFELAKVKTAYRKFESYRSKGLIPVLEKREMKIISEEHQFMGYCDSLGINDDTGKWMLGELKTTASFDAVKWSLLAMNTQVSLYTKFLEEFAHQEFLDFDDFQGVSYCTVTMTNKKPLLKSKAKKLTKASRREDENASEFQQRIKDDSECYHKIVMPSKDAISSSVSTFTAVKEAIHDLKCNTANAIKNTNNCFAWHRPCEYFETCHGLSPYGDEKLIKQETSIINDME